MKKVQIVLYMLCTVVLLSSCGASVKNDVNEGNITPVQDSERAVTLNIDTDASLFEWEGRKVVGAHFGTIDIASGEVKMEGNMIAGGSFVIDMTSIEDHDLTGDGAISLVSHLKSSDFFDVETYKEATFEITGVGVNSENSDNSYAAHIAGDLTIKGITNEIEFPATITAMEDGTFVATTTFDIDRTRWDIRFGSGKFFDDLGDNMIDDNFTVSLTLKTELEG